MTVVVTGASGHVGGNLVRALVGRGRAVRCVVRDDDRALAGLDVERVPGDVRDPESLLRAFAGAETVFHLAAKISIDGGQHGLVDAINVAGARNAAEAALAAGVRRFVHCCSIHAFVQDDFSRPVDESMPRAIAARHAAYDRSKALGEAAVREVVARGLDAVIVHPSGILGPCDFKPSRMGKVLLDLYERRLIGLVPGGFNWVDVRDVCEGLLRAESDGRTGESYFFAGTWASVRELAELAAAITGVPAPRLTAPTRLAVVGAPFVTAWNRVFGGEPLYTAESLRALAANPRADTSKAQRELGWSPRPLARTVYDCYAWFAEAGVIELSAPLREVS